MKPIIIFFTIIILSVPFDSYSQIHVPVKKKVVNKTNRLMLSKLLNILLAFADNQLKLLLNFLLIILIVYFLYLKINDEIKVSKKCYKIKKQIKKTRNLVSFG